MLKYPELWEQVEPHLERVPYGKLVVEIQMKEGQPYSARIISSEVTVLYPQAQQKQKARDDLV